MRSIKHPGPAQNSKTDSVASRANMVSLTLNTGKTLLDAVNDAIRPFEVKGAGLRLYGGSFDHFSFYMPALSDHPEHAVYFSDRYEVAGCVMLEQASVTVGARAGKLWMHCHAVWTESDGRRRCGHLIPDEVMVSAPITVQACLLMDATFNVVRDENTNFSLFKPFVRSVTQASIGNPSASTPAHANLKKDSDAQEGCVRAIAIRIAPNEDLCMTIEQVCRDYGFKQAQICGGVGSTVGASFIDGRSVIPFVTELLITGGDVQPSQSGEIRATVDVAIVDYTGGISSGRLVRGENPVLVTCELILLEI